MVLPIVSRPPLREFVAQVVDSNNVTRSVTTWARDVDHAREKLLALGYLRVNWVL